VTECYPKSIRLQPVQRRQVEAQFCGGDITGNGGIPLLGTVDRKLGLTQALARGLSDTRRKASCTHWAVAAVAATHLRLGSGLRRLERSSRVAP